MPARVLSARFLAGAALALLALAAPALAPAAQERRLAGTAAPAASGGSVPGALIVVWKDDATRAERLDARADAEAGFVRTLGDSRFQLLHVEAGRRVADALAALRANPDVQTATRNTYDVPHATTNDPLFGQLWGLQNVGAGIGGFAGALPGADANVLAAWDRTRGTATTVIADIDSGYRFDAPDLGPVAWTNPSDPANGADDDGNGIVDDTHGADFVGRSANTATVDGDPTDDNLNDGGHGVHTAGTMAAAGNNGVGISGVAQDVRIMPLRVCSWFTDTDFSDRSDDSGTICPADAQIMAINYAGSHGARAANMSLGGTTPNTAVRDALANNPGVLFVISAGNDGQNNDPGGVPHYPCAYDPSTSGIAGAIDNVLCVAATDQADNLAAFSDFGASTVDVGAPGTQILSTYPVDAPPSFSDDFETADFNTVWRATSGGGFDRTRETPLTSFGMSDTPGRDPPASATIASTSQSIAIPRGYGACFFRQRRTVVAHLGGYYQYEIHSNGTPVFVSSRVTTSGTFETSPIVDVAGTNLRVVVTYSSGGAPPGDGVWLDNLSIFCRAPLATPPGYDLLDGTSMAAPHVTGAAGLLFSLNPAATTAQVRAALLASVHPLSSLAGRTATGGRLDAAAALDEIRPLGETTIAAQPRRRTKSRRATFAFSRTDAPLGGTFQCRLDGGAFAPCSSPATFTVRGGRHTFAVRASSPRGVLVDPTPAAASWTVLQCKVPQLKGKGLRAAKKALKRAHCKLGKVRKARARRGSRAPALVVLASKPKRGARRAADAKVSVTLGAKPRPSRRGGRSR
ncbi:MAG TPA: S8 family serine peptidase [Conexibacter sp.]|nr:S8 family serine peptidase [Conexibacter sp.]